MPNVTIPDGPDVVRIMLMVGYTIIGLMMISLARYYWRRRDPRTLLPISFCLVSLAVVDGGFIRWGEGYNSSMLLSLPGAFVGVAFVFWTIHAGGLKEEDSP